MNLKLALALTLALGLLCGGITSHYFFPVSAFAQSQTPVLIPAPAQPLALTTMQGTKLAEFDASQGKIRLSPVVKLRINKTDRTVTLELSK